MMLPLPMTLDLLARIVVGSCLGGVIGYERDRHGRPASKRRIFLVLGAEGSVAEISTKLSAIGASVSAVEYDRHVADRTLTVTLDLRFPETVRIDRLIEEIEAQPDVRRIKLEQTL